MSFRVWRTRLLWVALALVESIQGIPSLLRVACIPLRLILEVAVPRLFRPFSMCVLRGTIPHRPAIL